VPGGSTFGRAADESLVAASDLAILAVATDPAFDARLDLGGRIARLALAASDMAEPGPLPATDFVMREWLSLLARAAAGGS
jgi:hypothetical protein